MVFDAKVTRESGDDEKDKYAVLLKADGICDICPCALTDVSIKLESNSDEIQRMFPRGKVFSIKIEASSQKQLRNFELTQGDQTHPEAVIVDLESSAITEANATYPEGAEEEIPGEET